MGVILVPGTTTNSFTSIPCFEIVKPSVVEASCFHLYKGDDIVARKQVSAVSVVYVKLDLFGSNPR